MAETLDWNKNLSEEVEVPSEDIIVLTKEEVDTLVFQQKVGTYYYRDSETGKIVKRHIGNYGNKKRLDFNGNKSFQYDNVETGSLFKNNGH